MKIGLLAYSTNTGLGYQTLDFYENMKPDKVLIADISEHNGLQTFHSRFPGAQIYKALKTGQLLSDEACEWLVDGMDVVFVCETPLNYHLYSYAQEKGVKVIQQYNYEFLDYFRQPRLHPPSMLASPSLWGMEKVKSMEIAPVMHWPVPVNIDKIPFRQINEVKTFVHIIGRPAAHDRNGTLEFLEAARKLGKEFDYIVYIQEPKEKRVVEHFQPVLEALLETEAELWPHFKIVKDCPDNVEMYQSGEVLILPRRYGGLCLPMWEALSAGMPVIMPNISPNNTILPEDWLIEATIKSSFKAHTDIIVYKAYVNELVKKMRFLAHSDNIVEANKKARMIAESMSWEKQKPLYIERLQTICA
jgi:glycosyltransferase involved in cell wall biosynthesis